MDAARDAASGSHFFQAELAELLFKRGAVALGLLAAMRAELFAHVRVPVPVEGVVGTLAHKTHKYKNKSFYFASSSKYKIIFSEKRAADQHVLYWKTQKHEHKARARRTRASTEHEREKVLEPDCNASPCR